MSQISHGCLVTSSPAHSLLRPALAISGMGPYLSAANSTRNPPAHPAAAIELETRDHVFATLDAAQ
jgi:hypothetical protein